MVASTEDDFLWAAILINAAGSIIINSGTNLIKYGNLWKYLGFILFLIGNAFTFGSMSLGPSSVLAAVSAVQFISNVFWSRILFGERPTTSVVAGTVVIIAADVMVVICAPSDSAVVSNSDLLDIFWFHANRKYFCFGAWCLFILLVFVFGCCYKLTPLPFPRCCCRLCHWRHIAESDLDRLNQNAIPAVIFVMLSAVIGSQSVICGKVLSLELRRFTEEGGCCPPVHDFFHRGHTGWDVPVAVVAFVFCISLWLSQLKRGLRFFRGSYVIPLQQVCWIFWTMASSLVTFEEYNGMTWYSAIGFAFGFVLLFMGVGLMSRQRTRQDHDSCTVHGSVMGGSFSLPVRTYSLMVDLIGLPMAGENSDGASVAVSPTEIGSASFIRRSTV